MTPLHSMLKRALTIDGRDYVLTLNETALKLTLKGKRNGVELAWSQLVNGEAALAVALHASLGAFAKEEKVPAAESPASAKASAAAKPAAVPRPKRKTRSARKK
jgi:Arc/MetJ family transcription regulator